MTVTGYSELELLDYKVSLQGMGDCYLKSLAMPPLSKAPTLDANPIFVLVKQRNVVGQTMERKVCKSLGLMNSTIEWVDESEFRSHNWKCLDVRFTPIVDLRVFGIDPVTNQAIPLKLSDSKVVGSCNNHHLCALIVQILEGKIEPNKLTAASKNLVSMDLDDVTFTRNFLGGYTMKSTVNNEIIDELIWDYFNGIVKRSLGK